MKVTKEQVIALAVGTIKAHRDLATLETLAVQETVNGFGGAMEDLGYPEERIAEVVEEAANLTAMMQIARYSGVDLEIVKAIGNDPSLTEGLKLTSEELGEALAAADAKL